MDEIEELDDEGGYVITDWVPPWLDNGERLIELAHSMAKMNDADAWQVMVCILIHHLDIDLKIAKEVNHLANKVAGEYD